MKLMQFKHQAASGDLIIHPLACVRSMRPALVMIQAGTSMLVTAHNVLQDLMDEMGDTLDLEQFSFFL